MKNQSMGVLMKSRSASACIKEGYGHFIGRFKENFRLSWPFALAYSLVCGLLCTLCVVQLPQMCAQTVLSHGNLYPVFADNVHIMCLAFVLIVVGGMFEVAAYSSVISRLKNSAGNGADCKTAVRPFFDFKTFVRTLKAALGCLLIVALAFSLLSGCSLLVFKAANASLSGLAYIITQSVLYVILMLFVALPLTFVAMKYVLTDGAGFWKTVFGNYSVSMKHLGFVFIVMLVSCIVIGIAELVLALPAYILAVANFQANMGILDGDSFGMPAYINYISAVVFFLAGLIQIYVRMSALFTTYYMYGSVENQEAERIRYSKTSVIIAENK